MNTCKDCNWAQPNPVVLTRFMCRYNPPQIFALPGVNPLGKPEIITKQLVPTVSEDEYCSKFTEKHP